MVTAPLATAQQGADDSMDRFLDRMSQRLEERLGVKSLARGYKHDASGTPTSTGYIHGPGGLLSYPGVDPDVFHTVVGAKGILGQLPVRPARDTNPLFSVITGVGDDSGAEKTEVCDPAPTAGILSACMLSSVFARYERATPELEINRLGQRTDRSDPMDLRLVGTPLADSAAFLSGPAAQGTPGNLLQNEVAQRMWELGVSLHRLLSRQLWTGNPANNNGDAYRELTSFPILVNTGHADVLTNTSCPSIDSDVKDFDYADVATAGSDLVNALTYIFRTRRSLAERTGVTPVRWVLVMREELFYEVSAVWPCAYLTYRCSFGDNEAARLLVSGDEQTKLRIAMREGRYLMIDDQQVEVVFDDGIPMQTSTSGGTGSGNVPNGAFASDIYLIPMSILGGRAVTYLEHFDYSNPDIRSAIAGLEPGAYTVDGPWITTTRRSIWCFNWQTKIEPRLILRTPWLAGRLQNVVAMPLQYTRSPFPDDPYFVAGGGVTTRSGPSYFTPLWGA